MIKRAGIDRYGIPDCAEVFCCFLQKFFLRLADSGSGESFPVLQNDAYAPVICTERVSPSGLLGDQGNKAFLRLLERQMLRKQRGVFRAVRNQKTLILSIFP